MKEGENGSRGVWVAVCVLIVVRVLCGSGVAKFGGEMGGLGVGIYGVGIYGCGGRKGRCGGNG